MHFDIISRLDQHHRSSYMYFNIVVMSAIMSKWHLEPEVLSVLYMGRWGTFHFLCHLLLFPVYALSLAPSFRLCAFACCKILHNIAGVFVLSPYSCPPSLQMPFYPSSHSIFSQFWPPLPRGFHSLSPSTHWSHKDIFLLSHPLL